MKVIRTLTIQKNSAVNQGHFVLEASSDEALPPISPGQFAEVRIDGAEGVFLRRPLSIHDVDEASSSIFFLVKIAGKGTLALSRLQAGSPLNVIFPLGRGFDLDIKGNALLVGGGCGAAPLLYLARILHTQGHSNSILLGAKSQCDLLDPDVFPAFGQVHISTDDGSAGEKGFVTSHSVWEEAEKFSMIYCCGPDVMMKTVAHMAEKKNIPCQVSLENTMACGIGACLCCVTKTVRGHECVCTSGPVFNSKELKWQI